MRLLLNWQKEKTAGNLKKVFWEEKERKMEVLQLADQYSFCQGHYFRTQVVLPRNAWQ